MADATPDPVRLFRGPHDRIPVPTRLRREFLIASGLGVGFLVGAGVALSTALPADAVLRWAAVSLLVAGIEIWLLRAGLPLNRPTVAGPVRGTLGWGNTLTLSRGVLLAGLAGFLVLPPLGSPLRWLPGVGYATAVLVDGLDGLVARRAGSTTALGEALDAEFDGFGLLVGSILAVAAGWLPAWYLAAGLARYVYIAALSVRRARGGHVQPIPPSRVRRLLAVGQMLVVTAALLPLPGRRAIGLLATAAMLPFLAGFARDWLVATGRTRRSI